MTATSDGLGSIPIVVHDLGGRGPPIVFSHAAGLHGLVWGPIADRLTRRFRCIAFDMRGHGDSGVAEEDGLDWRSLARDLLSVVDCLQLESPRGVGHSSGAAVLLLAEQARPGTFEELYCFEPAIVPMESPLGRDRNNWLARTARRRRELFSSRHEAYSHYSAKPPLGDIDPACRWAYVNHGFEDLDDGTVRLKCRPGTEALMYEMATAHDCFSHLSDVRCPVTLAWGMASEATSAALVQEHAGRLPRVRTEEFQDLGHLGPLENPDAVARSILECFDRRFTSAGP